MTAAERGECIGIGIKEEKYKSKTSLCWLFISSRLFLKESIEKTPQIHLLKNKG
jgi:hypothetical protein